MNKFWPLLWMVLLLCQVVTIWMSRQIHGEVVLPQEQVDPGLLMLAREINNIWMAEGILDDFPGRQHPASRNDNLLTRESLILELTRMEQELTSMGVGLEIVEDLQAYLRNLDGSEDVTTIVAYLSAVVEWVESCLVPAPLCTLERVGLYPGTRTGFPVLAFEMSGAPHAMGERLLAHADVNSNWGLQELDLLIGDTEINCWIRGSYAFQSPRNPHVE